MRVTTPGPALPPTAAVGSRSRLALLPSRRTHGLRDRALVTEFKHDEEVSRQRAAEHLVDIAYALTAGEALELRAQGAGIKVPVPERVLLKRESRSDGDRVEFEVVLRWSA
jgi:amphi-Trp domain-containing protein